MSESGLLCLTTATATLVLLIFLNVSQYVLGFFSIDIPVFKVAGGIILFKTGLSMIEGQATQLKERDEKGYTWFQISKQRFQKVIVPLVVPLLAGPGSITTVILYGSKTAGMLEKIELSIVLVATMLLLFGIFTYSYYIEKNTNELVFTVFAHTRRTGSCHRYVICIGRIGGGISQLDGRLLYF